MVAIATAANNPVSRRRSGDVLSQDKMAHTLTGLVDALSAWLYVDDSPSRIKSINETNRGSNRVSSQMFSGYGRSTTRGRGATQEDSNFSSRTYAGGWAAVAFVGLL